MQRASCLLGHHDDQSNNRKRCRRHGNNNLSSRSKPHFAPFARAWGRFMVANAHGCILLLDQQARMVIQGSTFHGNLRDSIKCGNDTQGHTGRRKAAWRATVEEARTHREVRMINVSVDWFVQAITPIRQSRREGVRQNAYRCVAVAARNRENRLRPPSPLCPVVTRRSTS